MKHTLSKRNDLYLNKNYSNKKEIEIMKETDGNYCFHTIYFNNIENNQLKTIFKNELQSFIDNLNLYKPYHAFIVGLGNDTHTADSIGPKSLKFIKANAYLENLGIKMNTNKISVLEPGSLGNTGIEAKRIIESVKEEINPDFLIVIDSFIINDYKYLNKTIQINNKGIEPGSGIKGLNTKISFETMHIPVIIIGVPTAIEISLENIKCILCSKEIDDYVTKITEIIGESINEVLTDFS